MHIGSDERRQCSSLKFIISMLAIKFPGLPQPGRQIDAISSDAEISCRYIYLEAAEITPSQGVYAESRNLRYPRYGRPFGRFSGKTLLVITLCDIQLKSPDQ
jgi:hypothetical protein